MSFWNKITALILISASHTLHSYSAPYTLFSCTGTWKMNGGGNWNVSGNWNGCIPLTVGDVASLGPIPTGPLLISLDISPTITSLVFNNTASYTITPTPSHSFFFDAPTLGGNTFISVEEGIHGINAPIDFPNSSPLDLSINDSLGLLTFEAVVGATDKPSIVNFSGPGQCTFLNTSLYTSALQSTGGTILVHDTSIGPVSTNVVSINSDNAVIATNTKISLLNEAPVVAGGIGVSFFINNGDLTLNTSTLFLNNTNTITGTSGIGSVVIIGNGNLFLNGGSISLLNSGMITSASFPVGPSGSTINASKDFTMTGGSITLTNSGALSGDVAEGSTIVVDNFTMNGGTITATNSGDVAITGGIASALSALDTVTINNGALLLTNTGAVINKAAVAIDSYNDFTVNGGSHTFINQGMVDSGGTGTGLISLNGNIIMNGGSADFENYGTVTDGLGSALYAQKDVIIHAGTINMTNFAPQVAGGNGVALAAINDFIMSGGNLTFTNLATVNGTGSGAFLIVSNDMTMNGGSLLFENFGNITQGQGIDLSVAGNITINQGTFTNNNFGNQDLSSGAIGSIITANDIQINGGLLTNNGVVASAALTINTLGTYAGNGISVNPAPLSNIVVTNSGTVIPGNPGPGESPGTMTIIGSYTQLPSGVFVANFLNDSTFSQLNVMGPVQLNGSIELAVTPGNNISPGVRFPVILGNSVLGEFVKISNFNLPPTLMPHVEYFPNQVVVYFSPGAGKYVKLNQPVFSSVNQTNTRLQMEMERMRGNFTKQIKKSRPSQKEARYQKKIPIEEEEIPMEEDDFYELVTVMKVKNSVIKKEKTQRLTESLANPKTRPWDFYLGLKGQIGNVLSKEDAQGYKEWSTGAFVGFDYAFSQIGLGLLIEYERDRANVSKDWGKFTIDNAHASLYSTYAPKQLPEFSIQGIIGGGYEHYSIDRNIGTTPQQIAKGTSNAGEFDCYLGMNTPSVKVDFMGCQRDCKLFLLQQCNTCIYTSRDILKKERILPILKSGANKQSLFVLI